MWLHLIFLFFINHTADCIYPPLNSEVSVNNSTLHSDIHGEATNIRNGKIGKWKQYNKFIKKVVKIVGTINLAVNSQCLIDLSSILSGASMVLGTAPLCAFHHHQHCPKHLPYWKLSMIDSWPRLPSGLTRKQPMFFLGDYDMCLKLWIHNVEAAENMTSPGFHYCRSRTKIHLIQTSTTITSGFCLPFSCNESVVTSLTNRFTEEFLDIFDKFQTSLTLEEVECHGRDEQWNYLKRILLALSAIVFLLLLVATFVDCYVLNNGKGKVSTEENTNEEYQCTITGSELTVSFDGNGAMRNVNCFNAPSIALTYKNIPDISRSFLKPAILFDILCSFSVRISLKHLSRKTAREIPSLNGIKVMSTLWVILGHSCIFALPYMDNLNTFLPELAKSQWLAPILLNSSLAVDSFLFISGSVIASNIRKRMLFRENERFPSFQFVHRLLMFYFHRVSRLWPSLVVTTLFMRFIYNHLGDGPMWSKRGVFGTMCFSEPIWPHLLFLSNWYPSHCLPWLWYTAVDIQLYILSPFFFLLLPRYRSTAFFVGTLLIIFSVLYQIAVYLLYDLPPNVFASIAAGQNIEAAESSYRLLHASPIARSAPFIIGMLSGWRVSVRSTKRPNAATCVLMKVVSISLFYFALFAPFCRQGFLSYIHAVLHRSAWSIALAILVWLCEDGLAPEVSFILSSHRLVLISRLSLGVFLTHEPILLLYIWTSRQPHAPHSFMYFVICTLTTFVLSLPAALVLALTIEIPILSMERKVFKTTDQRFEEVDNPSEGAGIGTGAILGETSFLEKTSSWLRAPDFQEMRLSASGVPKVMECTSTFSKESFFWQQEDWSKEPSLVDKGTQELPPEKRPLNLEQWERSLFSTC